jgi:hypothetical protein
MPYNIDIKNPKELKTIVDVIHDWWFDLDKIRFDPDTSTLSIPFSEQIDDDHKTESKNTKENLLLQIKHVQKYQINDTEKIGTYDFNEIEYDEDKNRLNITTGVPLGFEIYISGFEIIVSNS